MLLIGRLPPQKELNAIPVGRILPDAWKGLSASAVEFLKKATAPDLEARFQSFDECIDQLRKVDFGPDNRGLLLPGELPPLPSGAFITASATSIEGPAPLVGFDAELARRDGNDFSGGDLGDTMDLTTMDPQTQATAGAPEPDSSAGVGVKTGFETRIGPGIAAGPIRPTDGVREVDAASHREQVEGVGQTRAFTAKDAAVVLDDAASATQPEISASTAQALAAARGGGSSKALVIGGVLVLLIALAAVATMMSKGAAPDDQATLAALRAYESAVRDGDWSVAESTASGLPAAAAELDAGKVLLALDQLLAGEPGKAREQSEPLRSLGGELGARAGLVYAAASRLASVDGYADAIASYVDVAGCTDSACAALRDRAERARAEACLVAGTAAEGCSGLSGRDERTMQLLASLVLLEDGHRDRGQLVLTRALAQGDPDGSCVENAVLSRWAAESTLSAELRSRAVAAGAASARSAEQCALFAK